MRTNNTISLFPTCLSMLFLLLPEVLCSQPPRRIDPFDPNVQEFVEIGRIVDPEEGGKWHITGKVHAIGDCNNDGYNDWMLEAERTDTLVYDFGYFHKPIELFLFFSHPDTIPAFTAGARLGPTEIGSKTRFIASGDWDNDGNRDIACRIHLFNDSSSLNTRGATTSRLVIFWGNVGNVYSIMDTTVLTGGSEMELGLCNGTSGDIDSDGVEDLVIHVCAGLGFSSGERVRIATIQVFRGHDKRRWGEASIPYAADLKWWNPPIFSRLGNIIDQDCDNGADLVLMHDDFSHGFFSVLYGSPEGGFPDTNNFQTIDLGSVNGSSARLFDITADGLPELIVLEALSDTQKIRVYPGDPGKRLIEQYNNGLDPWAAFPTPIALHDGWGGFNPPRFYGDLGDANGNGYREIWAYGHPFFFCYTTRIGLDSLIDGVRRFDGLVPSTVVNLGKIDDSRWETIAFGARLRKDELQRRDRGYVFFLQGTHSIPAGVKRRDLPHELDVVRCNSTVSVEEAILQSEKPSPLGLAVRPNPSSGEVVVSWGEGTRGQGDKETRGRGDNSHHRSARAGGSCNRDPPRPRTVHLAGYRIRGLSGAREPPRQIRISKATGDYCAINYEQNP